MSTRYVFTINSNSVAIENALRYVPEHAEDDTDYKSTLDQVLASIEYLKNNEFHLRRFNQAYLT